MFICVDKRLFRQYGPGYDWIDTGLSNYVSLNRKYENGYENKTAACEESGMISSLEIVKGTTEYEPLHFEDEFCAS